MSAAILKITSEATRATVSIRSRGSPVCRLTVPGGTMTGCHDLRVFSQPPIHRVVRRGRAARPRHSGVRCALFPGFHGRSGNRCDAPGSRVGGRRTDSGIHLPGSLPERRPDVPGAERRGFLTRAGPPARRAGSGGRRAGPQPGAPARSRAPGARGYEFRGRNQHRHLPRVSGKRRLHRPGRLPQHVARRPVESERLRGLRPLGPVDRKAPAAHYRITARIRSGTAGGISPAQRERLARCLVPDDRQPAWRSGGHGGRGAVSL